MESYLPVPFKIGETVTHKTQKWYGEIMEIIWNSDGIMLYVSSGGYTDYVRPDEIERPENKQAEEETTGLPQPPVVYPMPLTLDQLKNMTPHLEDFEKHALRKWVWIEILAPQSFADRFNSSFPGSAYYRAELDYTKGRSFCCGYPGIGYAFDYDEYGKTWTAFSVFPTGPVH